MPLKRTVFVVFLGLIFFGASIVPALNAVSKSESSIVIDINFSCPVLEKVRVDGQVFDRVTMDGLLNSGSIDGVALPVRSVEILLPYGQQFSSVDVVASKSFSLGTGFVVEPMYRVVQLGASDIEEESMTERSGFDSLFSVVGSYVSRGYVILLVNLYPVQYDSFSGELVWYNEMMVSVGTSETDVVPVVRDVAEDGLLVLDRVENPEDMHSYAGIGVSISRDSVDYVIITNEELRDATGAFTFQDLVAAKEAKGMSAAIFTVEDIVANPDFWVNGDWGDNNPSNPFYNCPILGSVELFNDTQAMIRNFIRYAYVKLGTSYVLLGGDADYSPSQNIVPCRELYAVEDGLPLGRDLVEDDIPSDVYYACLDGNFNRDEDVHFGENETQNTYDDVDEADLFCEVYVGRACVDADDEVSNFVMKTLAYENEDDPYIFTALMVGEYLGFPGVSAYGGNYKDLIIPLFPEEYMVDTLYDRDGSWSKYDLMNRLNTETPHMVNHLGHGNVQYGLKMGTSDIASLTNDKFFFVYSQTCLAGHFDNSGDDCAAEYFTVETPHGAFAVIMNARYGLGSENTLVSPSQVLDESFFYALYTENLRALGQANHYSKENHVWHINENGIRWVYYETNLFGDPAVRIKPCSTSPEVPQQPDGPSEGVVDTSYTYETMTTDVEGDSIYYLFDWGDNSSNQWLGPYNSGEIIQTSHQWDEPGTYLVKVKAKDDNYSDDTIWSAPLSVVINQKAIMEIRAIKGGMMKVGTNIKNMGGVEATDVQWTISFEGGILFMGQTSSGTIARILPGEIAAIQSDMVFGFGKTRVTIIAEVADGYSDTRSQGAVVFLFLTMVNAGGG